MPLIVALVLVAVLVGMGAVIWLSFGVFGLALHLFMAGLIGALADAVVPGRLPWGWLGAILAGLVGSWLGTTVIGHVGPSLFGIPVIPGFLGAVVLAFGLSAVGKLQARR